jgi:hypothetical protein
MPVAHELPHGHEFAKLTAHNDEKNGTGWTTVFFCRIDLVLENATPSVLPRRPA